MIAVYSQAEGRQGIDAAIDGQVVSSDDVLFVSVRQRSIALNLKRNSIEVGAAKVSCGGGVARLQFESLAADEDSPIVVVLEAREFVHSIQAVANGVLSTAGAIDRRLDRSAVEQTLETAAHVMQAQKVHQVIVFGLAVCAAALAATAASRKIVAKRRTR